ncbi:MAG: hypothetical protein NT178_18825 [Proteobacteria bacterium]|nr:hypothetical protein [Pseudomonadota bacterium]
MEKKRFFLCTQTTAGSGPVPCQWLYLSQSPQGTQRKTGIFVSSIVRLTDPAHISFNSAISAYSNDRKGEGEMIKESKALYLAEYTEKEKDIRL